MPTITRIGLYRFFFYSNEGDEPSHVHVQRDKAVAKLWLEPVALARSRHFAAHELTDIQRLVEENVALLIEAWHDHHDN